MNLKVHALCERSMPNGKAHDICHLDFYWPGPDSQWRHFPICRRDMSGHRTLEINLIFFTLVRLEGGGAFEHKQIDIIDLNKLSILSVFSLSFSPSTT